MMDDSVVVRIVGDASAVAPAVDETTSSLGGLEGVIANINGWVDGLITKFAEMGSTGAAAGAALAGGMREAAVATNAEGNALIAMVAKVHEGAEAVRTFQMRAKEFAEVYVAMFAVEAIAHWAESMADAAEQTEHLSAKLGMTTSQVQALSGAATMSGTNIDVLAKGLGLMDNKAVVSAGHSSSAAKAFAAMGISANDGSTNMERLLQIADKFHGMADGPTKAALAMQLFGKSGREMIPFLNQGSDAIQQLMEKSVELGKVNQDAVEQGARLAGSVNEAKVAWDGLKQTLTQAFGPVLTELTDGFIALVKAMHDSYESGGTVKVIFDIIADAIRTVMTIVDAIGTAFSEMFASTGAAGLDWKSLFDDVFTAIIIAIKLCLIAIVAWVDACLAIPPLLKEAWTRVKLDFTQLKGDFEIIGTGIGAFMRVVGQVCYDALHFGSRWGDIKSDWNNGMEQVRVAVAQKTAEITKLTGDMRAQVVADAKASSDALAKIANDAKGIINAGNGPPKHDDFKFKFGGGDGDAPDITNPSKKKGKKPKDDLVQQLEEELKAKKDAWDQAQIDQDQAQEYSLQSEADFWEQAKNIANLSAKDKAAIEDKYVKAELAAQNEAEQKKLDAMKKEITADGANYAKKLADLDRYVAETKRYYGADSKQAEAAEKEKADAAKKASEDSKKAWEEYFAAVRSLELLRIDDEENQAKFEVEMGQRTKGELLQQQKDFEDRRYASALADLQRRLEIDKQDPNTNAATLQKDFDQIQALWQSHENKINEIDRQATLERTAIERQAIQGISQTFATNIGQMLTLTESFSQGVKNIWLGLAQTLGNVISTIIDKWLEKELTALIIGRSRKTADASADIAQQTALTTAKLSNLVAVTTATIAASKATAAAVIPVQVGIAGASGVASWAGAPWPIDAGAPAFGASMAAQAAALGAVAGFDVGAWDLSKDQLAMVHSGEMIIPANMADGMRSMFQFAGSGGTSSPAQGGGGSPVHLHYAPNINNGEQQGLKQLLANGAPHMLDFIHKAVRDGKLKLKPA